MKKEENKSVESVLKSFANNTLQIGEIIEIKDQIEKYDSFWTNLNDKNKVEFFINTIEKDEVFADAVKFAKDNLATVFIPSQNEQLVEKLSEVTARLDLFSRFVFMAYVGLTTGIKDYNKRDEKEPIDLIGCYRIGDWHLDNYYSVVKAFSISEMVSYWDGETALCRPILFKDGKLIESFSKNGHWDLYDSAWIYIIEYYLIQKNFIDSPMDMKNALEKLLKKDEILTSLHDDVKARLKNILSVENAYLIELEKLENIVKILKNYNPDYSYLVDDAVAVVQDFSGPHKTRGWDVRIRSSVIHLFKEGNMYRYEFDPYFEYQDYPGGQTYNYPDLEVDKVVNVKSDNSVVVQMVSRQELVIKPSLTNSFSRSRKKGEREKFYDDSFRIWKRMTYEGNPSDLDFSFQTPNESY